MSRIASFIFQRITGLKNDILMYNQGIYYYAIVFFYTSNIKNVKLCNWFLLLTFLFI